MDSLTEEEERTLNRVIFIIDNVFSTVRTEPRFVIRKSYLCAILFGKMLTFEKDDIVLT